MMLIAAVWFVFQLSSQSAFVIGDDVHEYCQLETFSARCHHGDVIVMTTARFGRMRVGKCIDGGAFSDSIIKQDDKTIGCYADVLDYADRMCSGKEACDISVPNRELLSTRPCFTQLTMYFEAAYYCVSVVEEDRSCSVSVSAGLRQHIRSSSEHSDSGRQRVRCGSRSHPWLLEAQTGQQVNISLLDFTGHDRRTQLDTRGLVSDDCSLAEIQLGYVVDKTNKKNVSICSTDAQHRYKHIYQSAGNVVEIVLSHRQLTEDEDAQIMNFLLSFEAVGCSNLVPPSDAWLRRTDNEATIGCYTTRQRWNLRCHGNQWKGTIGACNTNQDDPPLTSELLIHDAKDDNSNFVNVLLIVSISFVGLAVCLVIIFVGIGCARRYGIDKLSSGGRNLLVGCKDDQLITGQQDFQYNGQTQSQLLPQYFVLDKDAVEYTAN